MITQLDRSIYLASRSPRRRELLSQIGVRFQVLMFRDRPDTDAELDEAVLEGETPRVYVERVARAKAQAGWKRLEQRNLPRAAVLAADTTVAIDGRILGKPADRREAAGMLGALSGRRHEVLSAIVLKYETRLECAVSVSEVEFRVLSPDDIRSGLESFAGVEGRLQFVREIDGVKIYNDNNATTPQATIAALQALDTGKKNIILIMGGADKGLATESLLAEIRTTCKRVVLLKGSGSERVAQELREFQYEDLETALQAAIQSSEAGDILLFSPAFASFGMFKNEYDRNDRFLGSAKKL